jgi:hypothetical protein
MKCAVTGARAFACNVRQDGKKQVNVDDVEEIWACDIFACPACHQRTASNFGESPLFEGHQRDAMREYLASCGLHPSKFVWFVLP